MGNIRKVRNPAHIVPNAPNVAGIEKYCYCRETLTVHCTIIVDAMAEAFDKTSCV